MPNFFDVNGDPTMDPYTILSLPPTASEAEIKKAYRMQMLQLHPDKLAPTLSDGSIAAVTEKFHNVKDAYDFLVSPMHLTSRRLYQAKMASRRAEYERREAYLRRNGGADPPFGSTVGGFTTGYANGGGGGAGMAGSGMPAGNGYPHHRRSSGQPHERQQSEPPETDEDDPAGGERRRGRGRSGAAAKQPKASRGMHNSHPTTTKHKSRSAKERSGGYKSDSAGMKTKSRRDSETRQDKTRTKAEAANERREKEKSKRRGKSEQPRHRSKSVGERKAKAERKSREATKAADEAKRKAEKRRRARSAPARYANKSSREHRSRGREGRSSPRNSTEKGEHPQEWYCPLTKRLMKDPVMDEEGNTYEREAIERWLRVQSSSPITNSYLCLEMLKPNRQLKKAIIKANGKPRSKSQSRPKRAESPTNELVSGRVLVDSYLREISSKSKLSVSLDGMGICAFSYRRITFVIEVPITPHAGFMVYSSFDGTVESKMLNEKIDAWNGWLGNIGRHSRVSFVRAGQKTVFTLKGNEGDMLKCELFQKVLEYFVEMSLKLHNLLHPKETKTVENVCLTRTPVSVT